MFNHSPQSAPKTTNPKPYSSKNLFRLAKKLHENCLNRKKTILKCLSGKFVKMFFGTDRYQRM